MKTPFFPLKVGVAAFRFGAPIDLAYSSKTAYLLPRQKYVDNESELGVQQ